MVSEHKGHSIGDNASAKDEPKDEKNSIIVGDEDFTRAKADEHLESIAVLEHPEREALEKQVVRRLDMTLLPVLWVSRDG